MKDRILYEDNHLIIVNKQTSEIVQGDKTGDETLADRIKHYIKVTYNKPGKVFLGISHRIDRPTSGAVMFAKTSKALSRVNDMFKNNEIQKKYWAVVCKQPDEMEGELTHYLVRNSKQNKSYPKTKKQKDAKLARLSYKMVGASKNYYLLEVQLHTGRHHQIRAQLAAIGCPIKGDLKYGADRSNPNGGIHLHARELEFIHPVRKQPITVVAPPPAGDTLWQVFANAFQDDLRNTNNIQGA